MPHPTVTVESILSNIQYMPNGCIEYIGSRSPRGYGITRLKNGAKSAHRFFFEMFCEPIPKGMNLLHHCDNPPCINPGHLYVGTQKENVRDSMKRNRFNSQKRQASFRRGEEHKNSKISFKKVLKIRNYKKDPGVTYKKIGKHFGVGASTAFSIITGKYRKYK
jgi:hypothetical protein